MVLWTISFRDPSVKDTQITAASYSLTHEGRILSFFDDRGGEVFATPLHSAAHWAPHVPTFGGELRGPAPAAPYPAAGSRQTIEAQAAAAAGAAGATPVAGGPASNRLEGRLVATG